MIPLLALVFAALVLALLDLFRAEGKSATGWAVCLLAVYLIALAVRLG